MRVLPLKQVSKARLTYKASLEKGLIPNGLKVSKRPAIKPVTGDFLTKWTMILVNAETKLVELLLAESLQVVKELDKKLDSELKKSHPNHFKEKRLQTEIEQEQYKRKLELRRFHKWKKIEEKHVATELILDSKREQKGTTIKTMEQKQTTEVISDSENKLKDPPHSEINNIKGTENEILHNIKLNKSNITDNRKEGKKVRKVTYSDVVKGNANRDMGEKIVKYETSKSAKSTTKVIYY